ncbi:MAG: hypothetical protein K2O74_05355, partial [Eubacteriales bacterium]|nr:hypothetical protein [Eubacteriales bacterium]
LWTPFLACGRDWCGAAGPKDAQHRFRPPLEGRAKALSVQRSSGAGLLQAHENGSEDHQILLNFMR